MLKIKLLIILIDKQFHYLIIICYFILKIYLNSIINRNINRTNLLQNKILLYSLQKKKSNNNLNKKFKNLRLLMYF